MPGHMTSLSARHACSHFFKLGSVLCTVLARLLTLALGRASPLQTGVIGASLMRLVWM